MKRAFQVMIVTERSAKVVRRTVRYRDAQLVFAGILGFFGIVAYLAVSYMFVVNEGAANRRLKEENNELMARLKIQKEEVERINATIQRVEKFAAKVKTITRLNDPERNIAIGPLSSGLSAGMNEVMYAQGERIDYEDELVDSVLAIKLIESKLDDADASARSLETNMRELDDYFASQAGLLASTPSIRPIESRLLNSTFGMRKDPYTGQKVMHKGVDFAADHGADIFATADGVVVFAATRQNYGKLLVVDHGYGFQTHYAHLSAFKVALGDSIARGQVVASAGNTGLTTGVHLHYEIRQNGIPQDPERFILD
jgi:murein DD-endopeptidase MepM/ murein hydrolase activator NlpD